MYASSGALLYDGSATFLTVLIEGNSINATSRICGASKITVLRLLADAGTLAAQSLGQQAWASAWMPRLDLSAAATRNHQQLNDTKTDMPTRSVSLTATLPLWRAADRAERPKGP